MPVAKLRNTPIVLDAATAKRFAALALANIGAEYPHKLDHVMAGDADVVTPRALHPAFHGSFDWHSCVHMHWLLARIRRRFPDLPASRAVADVFDRHFTRQAISAEVAYVARPASVSFERTYGWAWLLKLAAELRANSNSGVAAAPDSPVRHDGAKQIDDRRRWSLALQPLADAFAARYLDFLPRTRYPIRHGVHANSAFGLVFAIDYADAARNGALAGACRAKAREWYADDREAPAAWEPSGADFLSPVLMEAELMRRVLDPASFAEWLTRLLPEFGAAAAVSLFTPAQVDDRSDPQLVHLDGLNLSRAWCLRGIAAALPAEDSRVPIAHAAADTHLAAGWRGLESDDFVGAHWLASFALLAVDP